MSLDALRATLPPYARDLGLNLAAMAEETVLTDQQKWGCFIATAHACGAPAVIRAVDAEASAAGVSADAKAAAKAAAAIMGMNNVYYRALHLLENAAYRTMPSRLRMNVIANPGVDKRDFELWALSVSAVNGCGVCLDAHETELKSRCMPAVSIQAGLRIAAVVAAVSQVLTAEAALAREFA